MHKPSELTEVLIAGAVGGSIAGAIGLAYLVGASPDSILTFLGSGVGSGLAVFGALWVEAHRRQKAFNHLAVSLVIPATVAMKFSCADDKQLEPLILTLRQSIRAFLGARTGANVENPIHQYAIQTCVFWMEDALSDISNLEDQHKLGELSRPQFIEAVKSEANKIIGPVEDFLQVEGVPKEAQKTFENHKTMTEGKLAQ